MGFSEIQDLEVNEALTTALENDGIADPTAIQRVAIPPILQGHNVVVESGTGTGKTLAYLLPILQRMRGEPSSRTAIFAPSGELAMQTLRVATRYAGGSVTTGSLVGSGKVTKSTRLIVGTPGRILELYARRKLKNVTRVILDEPDPILANQDADFLMEVLSRPEPKLQIVIAAATMGPKAERLAKEVMGPTTVRAKADDRPLQTAIQHAFVALGPSTSVDVSVARFIEENHCHRVILFANQDHLIRHLFRFLETKGLRPVSLFAERHREERKRAVAAFTNAKARVLLTNDAAARGLDVPDVDWVLHYELPHSAQAYLHRAGRTGRAGRAGRSVVFLPEDRRALLKRYAKELGIQFQPFARGRRER